MGGVNSRRYTVARTPPAHARGEAARQAAGERRRGVRRRRQGARRRGGAVQLDP
jgi:hypothetical protein